jgi:hypothetical protein
MAKPTLLELVQDILSDIDGDEVNDISDTIEATQVANVIRNTYRSIVEEFDLSAIEVAFQLEASGTSTRPTHMTIPSSIFDVKSIRYDVRTAVADPPRYVEIPYATKAEFLDRTSNNDSDDATYQDVTDPESGFVLSIRNNQAPSMWTTLDGGDTLIFDSFNSAVDSTLQTAKTQCLGSKRNDLTLASTSTIDLPETMQQLVYNEAREMCMELYKDGAPRKVNEASRRSKMKAKERQNKIDLPRSINLPDYGRK